MAMTEMTRETHGAPSYQILLHTLGYARSDRVRPMHGKVCNEPSCKVNGCPGGSLPTPGLEHSTIKQQ